MRSPARFLLLHCRIHTLFFLHHFSSSYHHFLLSHVSTLPSHHPPLPFHLTSTPPLHPPSFHYSQSSHDIITITTKLPAEAELTFGSVRRPAPGPAFGPVVQLLPGLHATAATAASLGAPGSSAHQGLQPLLLVAFRNREEETFSHRAIATATDAGRCTRRRMRHGNRVQQQRLPLRLPVCQSEGHDTAAPRLRSSICRLRLPLSPPSLYLDRPLPL